MASTAQLGPTEQLVEESKKDLEETQSQLKEIDVLIQQTAAEVDRLAQRNAQAASHVRQVESVFDTVPREEIRDAYTGMQENQQRLFTMRGQLERLQSDQKNLEEHSRFLRRVIELIGQQQGELGGDAAEGESEGLPTVVRVIEAQERERQRLSRQMHDGPAQSLTNLVLQAEICERLFDMDPERARKELANLKTSVGVTFQRVKNFITSLRPMMLDDLGLVPTLRRYVDDYAEQNKIAANLTISGTEKRVANYKEVTTFRVIQELMSNARDISQASSIQIMLDMGEDRIMAAVEDNGSGYDLAELMSGPIAEEMGLDTLRERVEMLQGRFQVESNPGRGTRVALEIPLP